VRIEKWKYEFLDRQKHSLGFRLDTWEALDTKLNQEFNEASEV